MPPGALRLRFSDLVRRLCSCPYAAALTCNMARMRHLLWHTVPLQCASSCCIAIDKKADKALQGRVMQLLNAVKFVPGAATASESDAASWLMANPSQLSALGKAAGCSVPASVTDVERWARFCCF
jgi:hypothetical protein